MSAAKKQETPKETPTTPSLTFRVRFWKEQTAEQREKAKKAGRKSRGLSKTKTELRVRGSAADAVRRASDVLSKASGADAVRKVVIEIIAAESDVEITSI